MQLHTFLLGVMRAPFSVLSDFITNDSACRPLLSSQPAMLGSLGHTHGRRNGSATVTGTARAPKGMGCAEGGSYGVDFGNGGFPQSMAGQWHKAASLQERSEALGGSWGTIRACPAAGEKGWTGGNCMTGEGCQRTRVATAAEWGLSKGQVGPPLLRAVFFPSPPGRADTQRL